MAIVSLFKVSWHNSRHNPANTQFQESYVVAASTSQDKALGTLIQTNNADNQTVTVDRVVKMQDGIVQ